MIKYKKYLDQYAFPKKITKNYKIKKEYEPKIFLFSKLKRKFDICLKLPSFEFIDKYYGDELLQSFYLDNIRKLKILKIIEFRVNLKLLTKFVYYFFNKRTIKLKKNEICLLGPYSHSYSHVIHEFFIRLIFLIEKTNLSIVWVPDNLKKYLMANVYKKTFSKIKFKFFPTNENVIFVKCNYLSHSNNRWLIKNKIKYISEEYIELANNLRRRVCKNHFLKHDSKFKYIVVSRSRAERRKLLNEHELISMLKVYNFRLVNFEDYDYDAQINIARNCKIMIGYHGAGLTNLFFMKPKSLVIEIYNQNYKNEALKVFSKALNVDYKSFKCNKNHSNLDGECNVKEITEYIKKKI
jgi:hypothetical protein